MEPWSNCTGHMSTYTEAPSATDCVGSSIALTGCCRLRAASQPASSQQLAYVNRQPFSSHVPRPVPMRVQPCTVPRSLACRRPSLSSPVINCRERQNIRGTQLPRSLPGAQAAAAKPRKTLGRRRGCWFFRARPARHARKLRRRFPIWHRNHLK